MFNAQITLPLVAYVAVVALGAMHYLLYEIQKTHVTCFYIFAFLASFSTFINLGCTALIFLVAPNNWTAYMVFCSIFWLAGHPAKCLLENTHGTATVVHDQFKELVHGLLQKLGIVAETYIMDTVSKRIFIQNIDWVHRRITTFTFVMTCAVKISCDQYKAWGFFNQFLFMILQIASSFVVMMWFAYVRVCKVKAKSTLFVFVCVAVVLIFCFFFVVLDYIFNPRRWNVSHLRMASLLAWPNECYTVAKEHSLFFHACLVFCQMYVFPLIKKNVAAAPSGDPPQAP